MAEDTTHEKVRRWLGEISLAKKGKLTAWHNRGDKIIDRYRDERPSSESLNNPVHKMNILWSNVETMLPAMYAKTPKPNVQRRNKDRDPIGRYAAIVLERTLTYCLNAYDFDAHIRYAVKDFLLPGRGQIWVIYDPVMKTGEDEQEYVDFEYAKVEYVNWKDFLTNTARTWDEVTWVAKKSYLSRQKLIKRFGEKIGKEVQLDHKPDESTAQEYTPEEANKATVWEIWDKTSKKVIFIAVGYKDGPLEERDPPCAYDGFFPCPRPLTATTATDSIIPTPDFSLYQDQAGEIDMLSQRIKKLTEALKVVGVYDASQKGLDTLLNDGVDNQLIPVDQWAAFAEKGGLKGVIDLLPITDVVAALQACYLSRDQAKQTLYEVTGIGDIIRGATDPNETLGAQQLKSQWGSIRIRDRQQEIQRFARDIMRLKSEIIAEHFSVDTIKAMSGVQLLTAQEKQMLQMQVQQQQMMGQQTGQPVEIPEQVQQQLTNPTWDEVIALLRNEKMRGFAIEVETDSTIQPDEIQEKQSAVELAGAVTQFITGWGPIIQQAPQLAPLMGEILMFTLRKFKAGETMESVVEQAVESIMERAKAPPPPDPKMQAEQEKAQREAEKQQHDMTLERERFDHEKRLEEERLGVEKAKAVEEALLKRTQQDNDFTMKRAQQDSDMGMKREQMARDSELEGSRIQASKPILKLEDEGAVANALLQAQTQTSTELQNTIMLALQEILKAIQAPKQITVERNPRGQVVGGTTTPMMVQ